MRNKSETVQVVLGTGLHQKLVLTPMKWKPEKRWAPSYQDVAHTRVSNVCTFTFYLWDSPHTTTCIDGHKLSVVVTLPLQIQVSNHF